MGKVIYIFFLLVFKSDELKARLRKLAERAERNEYRELVKDIMPKNETIEPFSSYKDQIGFGKVTINSFSMCFTEFEIDMSVKCPYLILILSFQILLS